jgi:hypothetical protein
MHAQGRLLAHARERGAGGNTATQCRRRRPRSRLSNGTHQSSSWPRAFAAPAPCARASGPWQSAGGCATAAAPPPAHRTGRDGGGLPGAGAARARRGRGLERALARTPSPATTHVRSAHVQQLVQVHAAVRELLKQALLLAGCGRRRAGEGARERGEGTAGKVGGAARRPPRKKKLARAPQRRLCATKLRAAGNRKHITRACDERNAPGAAAASEDIVQMWCAQMCCKRFW